MYIKDIIKLQKSNKKRIKNNYIIVEGNREIKMALKGNFKIYKIFICKEIFNKIYHDYCIFKQYIIYINKKKYKKISYRNKTEGILGVFKKKNNYSLKEFKKYIKNKNNNSIVLIIDNIEKPGNIGSIIRTVEATNIINFIIFINKKDIYNPNIIRSSLGCIFIVPILILNFNDFKKYIINNYYILGTSIYKKNNLCLYQNNINIYNKDIGIILGNEHNGISKIFKKYIKNYIHIPMYGEINSLNVSNSFAIIIYEILRIKLFNIKI
ncbi:TrmH family RNA methyltransferase [Candidatus Shikimatogenerans bostrichidophilus]|uniref:TrmH family RNA methyltransferase n=1 Tax=Candidatus Shikimatogenerans bostrichidophilus TaxID=2943807 RepID=UPI0029662261